jgi:hypothetical protein
VLGIGALLLAAVVWGAVVAQGQVAGADTDPGGDRAGAVRALSDDQVGQCRQGAEAVVS